MKRRGIEFFFIVMCLVSVHIIREKRILDSTCLSVRIYEGWNFYSGNYLFTTDTK